ncbi:MAG: OmpH family outer membrane protein [Thermoplasmata archaeon]
MTRCADIYAFLNQVNAKQVTSTLSAADASLLSQLDLIQILTADQFHQAQAAVQALGGERQAIAQEMGQRARMAQDSEAENRRTHSFLFHLEGKEKQDAELQRASSEAAQLQSTDRDLAQKQQEFAQLVAQQSLLDTLTTYGGGYVGLTSRGAVELRDLGLRLYRVSDSDFTDYWNRAQKINVELGRLAAGGAEYFARLSPALSGADRSLLWGISIGLSKAQPNAAQGSDAFVTTYRQIFGLSGNNENRLMSSEILFSLPRPIAQEYPGLVQVLGDVRHLNVPSESALGVASILLLGRREDGTIATPNLAQYLGLTRSYESAALLSIVNLPISDQAAKFQSLRSMFAGWGYQPSEDVELSSAYLTVSELPADGISTKLAIIAKGLSSYLQFPLVAASVLASVSTLEANETLNLLEHAYETVGPRAAPLSQAELICLAVRMVQGIRDELVAPLDATAALPPPPPRMPGVYGPRFFFVPIFVVHQAYFSTYSGIGGAHPGHAHGFGGGVGGGGGGVG